MLLAKTCYLYLPSSPAVLLLHYSPFPWKNALPLVYYGSYLVSKQLQGLLRRY
jgi:hypothetical protein